MCDSNFWLELNYLEVAKAAQSCSAHFTALLYTEIYVDKLKANMEDSHRWAPPPSFQSCVRWMSNTFCLLQVQVQSNTQTHF